MRNQAGWCCIGQLTWLGGCSLKREVRIEQGEEGEEKLRHLIWRVSVSRRQSEYYQEVWILLTNNEFRGKYG
ncbi:hypothetical protein [Rubritalea tangerina]|uniref:hypothetical protein n=1 Tax=Rubritalea tangerina TaxID=430798 RepID=UPI0036112425